MDLDFDFFEVESKDHEVKQGRVLISEPFLPDTYFKRSIVFITEHNEEGTVGFILNKPVHIDLPELLKDFPVIDAPVSLGGPVGSNTVHYIHTLGDQVPKSVKVLQQIHWGGDFETIKDLIKNGKIGKGQIRFFVGYSGWMPKQLDNEIAENSWLVTNMDPRTIMTHTSKDAWRKILRSMNEKKYRMWADFPENPGNN